MLLSNPWLIVHIIAVTLAVPVGAAIFAMPKGTARHRTMGYAYFALMIVGNLSIMPVEARIMPFGESGFGIFHAIALLSLFSLTMGGLAMARWIKTRDPEALRSHQINLGFSYLGLIMALASEVLVNRNLGISTVSTPTQFWTMMAAVNIILYIGGSVLIFRAFKSGDPTRFKPRSVSA
jgi:uncharacterized membrane protein